MVEFKEILPNILLSAVFVIAIFTFATGMFSANDKDISQLSDGSIDYTELQEQTENMNANAGNWTETFQSDSIFIETGSLVLKSIWGILKLMWTAMSLLFNILITGSANVLGIPSLVVGTIITILVASIILTIWKVLRQGEA